MTETEEAFERFRGGNPLVATALAHITADRSLVRALLWATFAEGARYATDRCAAAGHRHE